MKMAIGAALAVVLSFSISPVFAADHEVQMVNKDAEGRTMQFEPAFLRVEPGDTVTFINKDKGHNSESLKGAIPEGAEAWKGKINQEITITLTEEGFYAYKCTPHLAMGMVGLIQVGDDTSNQADIEAVKLPGKSKTRMEELLAEAAASAS